MIDDKMHPFSGSGLKFEDFESYSNDDVEVYNEHRSTQIKRFGGVSYSKINNTTYNLNEEICFYGLRKRQLGKGDMTDYYQSYPMTEPSLCDDLFSASSTISQKTTKSSLQLHCEPLKQKEINFKDADWRMYPSISPTCSCHKFPGCTDSLNAISIRRKSPLQQIGALHLLFQKTSHNSFTRIPTKPKASRLYIRRSILGRIIEAIKASMSFSCTKSRLLPMRRRNITNGCNCKDQRGYNKKTEDFSIISNNIDLIEDYNSPITNDETLKSETTTCIPTTASQLTTYSPLSTSLIHELNSKSLIKHSNLYKSSINGGPHITQYLNSDSFEQDSQYILQTFRSNSITFSWSLAEELLLNSIVSEDNFFCFGQPIQNWKLTKIPTLGASNSCRSQEMYKATVKLPSSSNSEAVHLFVKRFPVEIWRRQLELQREYNGEYVTDGENFAMETAAVVFLQKFYPGICPIVYGIVEQYNCRDCCVREVSYILIITELYGEDLLDYLDRREQSGIPLNQEERKKLQQNALNLLRALHLSGMAHLDFTPENILIGNKGLKLCDFSKATPLWSNNIRHVKPCYSLGNQTFIFESCEPTVGKGAYMPFECWKTYWHLERNKIQQPLKELQHLKSAEERRPYYFRTREADIYMLGVLIFWLWAGGVWKCSDYRQDIRYRHLVRNNLDFDIFQECKNWPLLLKDILQMTLQPEPWRRATLEQLADHQWWDFKLDSVAQLIVNSVK